MKTIIANWKSNKSFSDTQKWWEIFQDGYKVAQTSEIEVVIAPPAVGLSFFDYAIKKDSAPNVVLGLQDLSPFPAGAYTGAISTQNVEGLNVKYALVGHSERRRYFHETFQEIANKVDQALQAGITPIVCLDVDYFAQQMNAIPEESWAQCAIAYEPLSAIGSGVEEPVEKVQPVVEQLRNTYKPKAIYYGGSVSVSSVVSYLDICDGALVGTHSLNAEDFLSLVFAGH